MLHPMENLISYAHDLIETFGQTGSLTEKRGLSQDHRDAQNTIIEKSQGIRFY